MNDQSQHEFDDELLSAYLDDELSAEERALVEARLAADPAAQQSLDQLRNVSQSIRGLPKQALPGDFREAVLRRIESTKDAPVTPHVSIGRTRRGWIWATLAVAAALLIMVVQSDETDEGAVTDVALNEKPSAGKNESLVEAPAQWRASGNLERSEPEVSDGVNDLAAAPAARVPVTRDLSESVATSEPAHASASTRSLDRYSKEGLTNSNSSASESAEGRSSSVAAAPTAPPAESATEPQTDEDDVVVVHILAKQAAIKNKVFDKLLADNGVVVDSADEVKTAAGAVDELQQAGQEGAVSSGIQSPAQSAAEIAPASEEAHEEVDVVLVEAPSDTIFSCMEDLKNDSSNYLSVLVDAPPTTDDEAKIEAPAAKKLATDLGVYNRGADPARAKDAFGDKAYYYLFQAESEAAPADQKVARGAGGAGGFAGGKQETSQSLAFGSNFERGRARRLQPQAQNMPGRRHDLDVSGGPQPSGRSETRSGVELGTELMKRRAMLRELKESSRRGGEEPLQVLFVLRSGEESPPSAPAADRAE